MRDRRWFQIGVIGTLGALLFACSSKEKKLESSIEPSAVQAQVSPNPITPNRNEELQLVHFVTNAYNLSNDARKALKANADWLKKHGVGNVEIQGHCDERGSATYNAKLGEKRAKAVKNYLVKLGIKSSRLKVASYGFDQPLDPGHNEEAWSQNRRAASVLVNQNLSRAN